MSDQNLQTQKPITKSMAICPHWGSTQTMAKIDVAIYYVINYCKTCHKFYDKYTSAFQVNKVLSFA